MTGVTHVDDLVPARADVGWGVLGVGGRLGYEGKNVVVAGHRYAHALGTHAPATVTYAIEGDARRFRCAVALNDDVDDAAAEADFDVVADGRVVASAQHVVAGEPPRELDADLGDAQTLELVVTTPHFANCHAVWIEPRLEQGAVSEEKKRRVPDAVGSLSIEPPPDPDSAPRSLVTLAGPGDATALDDLLGSFLTHGACPDARLVVLLAGEDDDCERIVAKYGALAVHARPREKGKPAGAASLASLARLAPADRFLCIAPGALVVGDLRPLYASLDVCAPRTVLHAGDEVYAGTQAALADLEGVLRKQVRTSLERALRKLDSSVELDVTGRIVLPAEAHAERGSYAAVADPLAAGGDDAYAAFVDVLRGWIGRNGVRDPSTFPLLALLHYHVRSNGCARVLETGTAKGVSAACLASAVAHRRDARVVTLDLADEPLRASLWDALPASMRDCIEERREDSVEGMRRALAAGEQFDAALLDTDHSAGHVWREFDVARRLVRPGGPILVHDPGWELSGVEDALTRIAGDGYGVVRLWNVDGAVQEDDGLGLAMIENRQRP
jgi:cephalosporin hydroxylase